MSIYTTTKIIDSRKKDDKSSIFDRRKRYEKGRVETYFHEAWFPTKPAGGVVLPSRIASNHGRLRVYETCFALWSVRICASRRFLNPSMVTRLRES
jgi:hypothetical protein